MIERGALLASNRWGRARGGRTVASRLVGAGLNVNCDQFDLGRLWGKLFLEEK